jgi:PPM family protein phosphatase
MSQLQYHAVTFVGRRENNEDAHLELTLEGGITFLAVADGMGGATSGEVASSLVLHAAEEFLRQVQAELQQATELKQFVRRIFDKAQNAVHDRKQVDAGLQGMGTTMVCLLALGNHYVIGNLGDSRAYLVRQEGMVQLTQDHSYVQDYLEKEGTVAPASLLLMYANYLTHSIDGGADLPDIFPKDEDCFSFKEGECVLLCSDGLTTDKTSQSPSEKLRLIIEGTRSLRVAAEQLISNAFYSGSSDNITVSLVQYGGKKIRRRHDRKLPFPPRESVQGKAIETNRRGSFATAQSVIFPSLLLSVIGILIGLLLVFMYPPWKWAKPVPKEQMDASEASETVGNREAAGTDRQSGKQRSISSQDWKPFKSASSPGVNSFSISADTVLRWDEYPETEPKSYNVHIKGPNRIVDVTVTSNYLSLRGMSPGDYQISIEAVLTGRSSVKKGPYPISLKE